MKQTLFLLLTLVLISACASAKLTDGGRRVRLVNTTPANCEHLGEVHGDENGDSTQGGMRWSTTGPGANERARVDIKNMAANMGADTVELTGAKEDAHLVGEAYRCKKD
jgi:hypothetical protein